MWIAYTRRGAVAPRSASGGCSGCVEDGGLTQGRRLHTWRTMGKNVSALLGRHALMSCEEYSVHTTRCFGNMRHEGFKLGTRGWGLHEGG